MMKKLMFTFLVVSLAACLQSNEEELKKDCGKNFIEEKYDEVDSIKTIRKVLNSLDTTYKVSIINNENMDHYEIVDTITTNQFYSYEIENGDTISLTIQSIYELTDTVLTVTEFIKNKGDSINAMDSSWVYPEGKLDKRYLNDTLRWYSHYYYEQDKIMQIDSLFGEENKSIQYISNAKVDSVYYWNDGKLRSKIYYEYDEQGRKIEVLIKNKNETMWIYRYKDDEAYTIWKYVDGELTSIQEVGISYQVITTCLDEEFAVWSE